MQGAYNYKSLEMYYNVAVISLFVLLKTIEH